MDAHLQQVHECLAHTLSPDQRVRHAAEESLQQNQYAPQHVVMLFRLAADSSLHIETPLRQAAVIRMKNVISSGWGSDTGTPAKLGDADKAMVRDNLVDALIVAPQVVRTQLGLCLRAIAAIDYPHAWPSLLPTIAKNLSLYEPARLQGALHALRVLVKNFEFRRDEMRAPLLEIVNQTFPLLSALLQAALQAPTVEGSALAHTACKIFWSATQLSLPPLLLDLNQASGWCELMLSLLQQPLPPDSQPTDNELAMAWAPWKLKKRAASVLQRLLSRFGNPNRGKQGAVSAEVARFAEFFQEKFAARALATCLEVLTLRSRGQCCPDRVMTICLNYVDESFKYKKLYAVLKPHLQPLLFTIVFPLLCFSDRDAMLWEEDPVEFVRKEFDVIEDFYSPRTAAVNVLLGLAKDRSKDTVLPLVQFCSEVLRQALNSSDVELLRRKDGALVMLGALHERLTHKAKYKPSLEPMLKMHVFPDFNSPIGFLRQRACCVYGQYALSLFRKAKAGADNQISEVFLECLRLMQDKDLPVRVRAALCINNIVEGDCCAAEVVLSVLPQLVERLFVLINDIGNDEVVSTLDNLIESYGDQMVPYAVQVVEALSKHFLRLLDEQDEDDDDSALAAMGVLQATTTMLQAVCSSPTTYPQMEPALLPLITRCLKKDAQDHLEDVLEVLSYLTYYSPEISPALWSVFPKLHECFHVWADDYVNSFLTPIDNYISRSTEVFLTAENGAYLEMVVSICRGVMTSDNLPPQEMHGAAKLLESLLHNCRGRIDHVMPTIFSLTLPLLNKTQTASLKLLLYNVVASAIIYHPQLALQVLEHRQEQQQTLTNWMNHLNSNTMLRVTDLKVNSLATSALLSMPSATAPSVVSSNKVNLVRASLLLLHRLANERNKAEKEDSEISDEGEDGNPESEEEDEDDNEDGDVHEKESDFVSRLLQNHHSLDGFDNDFEDDLEEEEMYSTPLDNIDEYTTFADALHQACEDQPQLLVAIGLAQGESPPVISAEEVAALNAAVRTGIERKAQAQLAADEIVS